MTTDFVWSERFAWHDAGRASTSEWSEPYPAHDRPESKRRLCGLVEVSGRQKSLPPVAPWPATCAETRRPRSVTRGQARWPSTSCRESGCSVYRIEMGPDDAQAGP